MSDTPAFEATADSANVRELINQRVNVYGDPVESYTRIAQVFSGILGSEVQPWQVPMLMMGLKMVRMDYAPDYSDNSDDVEGYLDIFRSMIGEDMIHARSVSDYVMLKYGR